MSRNLDEESTAFVVGYAEAERQTTDSSSPEFKNPFQPGTEQYRGFEEGVCDFTQK